MLNVFDQNQKKIAVLENAFNVSSSKQLNAIPRFGFSLPLNDIKNAFCVPFNFVRLDGEDDLYIIVKTVVGDEINYECEHCISLLLYDPIFGSAIIGNLGTYTTDVISFVLNKQSTKNWVLKDCEFTHQFEYVFENENLLSALFSIPKPFVAQYQWIFDTSQYPWQISLKKINTTSNPDSYIRTSHNLVKLTKTSSADTIATRIYPLGVGEGVYQLNISEINNGIPYVQSSPQIVAKYGIKSRIWIDRRYESAETLKSMAESILAASEKINEEFDVDIADIDNSKDQIIEVGKVICIIGKDKQKLITIITKIDTKYDGHKQTKVTIATNPNDLAGDIANLAEKQRIEESHSQGASQIFALAFGQNCDTQKGAILPFYMPDLRILKKVWLIVDMDSMRSDFAPMASNGGQAIQLSTQSQSQTISTSTQSQTIQISGQSVSASVSSKSVQVQSQATSATIQSKSVSVYKDDERASKARYLSTISGSYPVQSASGHTHGFLMHYHTVDFDFTVPGQTLYLSVPGQSLSVPGQTLYINIPQNSASITIPSQNLSFTINGQTMYTTLQPHTHTMQPQITTYGSPTSFQIWINNVYRKTVNARTITEDISAYFYAPNGDLLTGRVDVKIVPNTTAYVNMTLQVEGFIQSRGN